VLKENASCNPTASMLALNFYVKSIHALLAINRNVVDRSRWVNHGVGDDHYEEAITKDNAPCISVRPDRCCTSPIGFRISLLKILSAYHFKEQTNHPYLVSRVQQSLFTNTSADAER
jgi:hypothetical protein